MKQDRQTEQFCDPDRERGTSSAASLQLNGRLTVSAVELDSGMPKRSHAFLTVLLRGKVKVASTISFCRPGRKVISMDGQQCLS